MKECGGQRSDAIEQNIQTVAAKIAENTQPSFETQAIVTVSYV